MNGEVTSDLSAGASSAGTKPWEKPWSIDELKKSSTSWSLACDAGLLQHMQEYSQRLISQTHDIQAQMDGLAHEAKLTNSRLSNVFNDFITLANTQFMENRVYDEEVVQPVEEKSSEKSSDNKTKTKEEKEAELIPKIKEAISLGLNVFDSAYETLDMNVANSDSEDEISVTKADIILEPKDPYINRILPYLIGSEQFHRLDDLGLKPALSVEKEDSGSESEDEVVKQAEVKRNSIPNSTSVKRQSIKESEDEDSDNSDLFGAEKKEEKPDESSSESAGSEDESDNNKQTTNKPKDFSSELAAKLGLPPAAAAAAAAAVKGSAGEEKVNEEVNDKKSKAKRRSSKSEEQKTTEKPKGRQDLFGSYDDDNADDGDDLFSKPTGLFSSKAKGLFDNEDEDEPAGGLFDKKQEPKRAAEPKQQKSVIPEQKKPETSKPNQPSINPATDKSAAANKDLFGEEEDEDDDDLFASLAAKPRAAAKTGQTIISDSDSRDASDSSRPSSAVSDSSTKAKPKLPAGAVSLFGGADDPFKSAMKQKDQLEGKMAPSDAKKSSLLIAKEPSSNQTSSGTSSLFGDDDDDGDDLFGASSKQTKSNQPQTKSTATTGAASTSKPAQTVKASLFADDDDDGGDLFGSSSTKKIAAVKKEESRTESKKPVVSNPVKDDDDDDDDLFAFKPKSIKNDMSKLSSEAASASKSLSTKAPSTDTDKSKAEISSVDKSKVPQNKAISLFGDDGDDDDDDGDLFSAATKKKTSVEESSKPKKRSPEKTKPSRGAGGGGDLFADEDLLVGSGSVDTPAVDLFKPVQSSQNNSPFNPLTSSKSEPGKTSTESKPAAAAVDKQKDKTNSAASSGLFGANQDNDDNDADDDLFSTKPAKKIPPGAISLFGNQHDLFAAVSKRRKSSSTDESSESKSRETTSPAKTTDSEKSNVIPTVKLAVSVVPKREKSVEKQLPDVKADDKSAIKANPVVQAGTIGNKPAASNLFSADDEVNEDDDDLFSTKPAKRVQFKSFNPIYDLERRKHSIPPGAVSLFGNQSDLLKEAVNKRRRSSTDESVDGRETKSPEKSIPIIPKASDSAKETDENKPSAPKSKISQLQSSLNIDPTANLPGAKPKVPAAVEISVGFNAPPTASTLNSIVKDRVKVQTKRRPPSRKTTQATDEVDEPDTSLVNSSTNGRLPSVDKLDSLNSEIGKSNLSQPKSPTSHLGNEDDLFSSTKVSLNKSEKEISNKTSGLSNSSADAKDISVKQDKSNDVKINNEITEKQQERATISSNKDSSKIKDDGGTSNSTPSDNADALDASGTVKNTQKEKSVTNKNATTKSLLDRLDDADLFSISNLGSKSSKPSGKKLILSDDDDDLFGSGKTSKNSTTKSKAAPDDLFGDSTVKSVGKSVNKKDDRDLFPKVNQSSKSNVSNKPAVQLDDDDIFSSSSLFTSSKKPPESKSAAATGAAKINKGSDEDIFTESLNAKKGATNVKQSKVLADNDSDEDIFADSSLLKKPTASKSAVESKSQGPPTSSIRKKAVTKDENLFTDDTDIFSTASKPSSQLTGKTTPANKKPVDEDDIFSDQSISQKSTATSKSSSAAAGMKRVDSSDIFNDPLNALQK